MTLDIENADILLYNPVDWATNPFGRNMLVSLDGLHSGVPTRTTPTLTPTTLRNIEQTFYELQSSEALRLHPAPSHQAGFVPPPAQHTTSAELPSYIDNTSRGTLIVGGIAGDCDSRTSMSTTGSWQSPPPAGMDTPPQHQQGSSSSSGNSGGNQRQTTRRNTGGRRPTKAANISPEEEERRCVRRERNKMAAARCRKRRMDHTNELIDETEQLERKRLSLQGEIQQLQQEKDELEFLLEAHRACCRRQATTGMTSRPNSPPDVKPFTALLAAADPPLIKMEPIEDDSPSPKSILSPRASPDILKHTAIAPTLPMISMTSIGNTTGKPMCKPNRPNMLNLPMTVPPSQTHVLKNPIPEIAGVPITTPSTGIPFNFESLMDGGTGLTPVSAPLTPNCRNQPLTNVNANGDLETPTQNKLVSL